MKWLLLFIYLLFICTGHITTGSWKGRGNQYIQFVRVLYCKLPTNGKQLPAFPLEAVPETEPRPQRWEARVLSLCHCGPYEVVICGILQNSKTSTIMENMLFCLHLSKEKTLNAAIFKIKDCKKTPQNFMTS